MPPVTVTVRRFCRYTVFALIMGAIPLIVLGINLYALHCWMEVRDLERNGIATEAIVASKAAHELPRNSTYRLTLRYEARLSDARSVTLTTDQMVDESLYRRAIVGRKVDLYYVAATPERVHIRGNDIYIKYVIYALVANLLLAIAAVGLYRMARRKPAHSPTAV